MGPKPLSSLTPPGSASLISSPGTTQAVKWEGVGEQCHLLSLEGRERSQAGAECLGELISAGEQTGQ